MRRKPALPVLLAVALAVAATLFLRRPPPVPPPVVLHPTAARSTQARRHMQALQQQLRPEAPAQEEAPPRGTRASRPQAVPPRPRTLRLSEDDLNVYLAEDKAARKILTTRGVKAVQIILSEPSNLTIRAAIVVKGHPQNIQIDGGLAPDPKLGLRFTATHAQVGRFPLPPAVVTAQADALAARLAGQMHGHLPLTVQRVQVQGKMLVLTGLLADRSRLKPPAPASPPPASPARR